MSKHFFIAGPCVIESSDIVFYIAEKIRYLSGKFGIEIIFKASFDKANRTSIESFRGPGIHEGLKILESVKKNFSLKLLTDIHTPQQADIVKDVVDVIQIPAFLCRQTDMLVEAGKTGRIVNIKKGQFLAPWDIKYAIDKVKSTGNNKVWITERGSSFGYNNLVVDFRGMRIMKEFNHPVIYDVTHSMQLPSINGVSGGMRDYAKWLAFAAAAIGVEGLFFEVHKNPQQALSDASVMLSIDTFEQIIPIILEHWEISEKYETSS